MELPTPELFFQLRLTSLGSPLSCCTGAKAFAFLGLRSAGAPVDIWQTPCPLGLLVSELRDHPVQAPHFVCEETETARRGCPAYWKT